MNLRFHYQSVIQFSQLQYYYYYYYYYYHQQQQQQQQHHHHHHNHNHHHHVTRVSFSLASYIIIIVIIIIIIIIMLPPLCKVFKIIYLKQTHFQNNQCCSYSIVTLHGTCNFTFHVENFVLLLQYCPLLFFFRHTCLKSSTFVRTGTKKTVHVI